jgi:exodeoxyribonuclease-3
MKFATWNVNSLGVRLPQVLEWLSQQAAAGTSVDVLALQELKLADEKFPVEAFREAGYHACWVGQKTYNGVALISRVPLGAVVRNLPGFADEQARLITATVPCAGGDWRVIGGYFPNGQAPGTEKFDYKMRWLDALRMWVAQEMAQHPRLVLMGDFNITFDDQDVWDPAALRETIHCTSDERHQLARLTELGLVDALRLFPQPERTYTWWDYRDFAFRRKRGLRIDHILVSAAARCHVKACGVDVGPRRNERPSDHAPVWLLTG